MSKPRRTSDDFRRDMEARKAPVSWRDVLPVHPAADLFPLLSETDPAALKALGEDIKQKGRRYRTPLQQPITLWVTEDKPGFALLDGRNRLDAMEAVGMEVITNPKAPSLAEMFTDIQATYVAPPVDPYEYVLSANIHRRHLTAEKKRELIAEVLKAKPATSDRALGKLLKADHKTIGAVRSDLESTGELSPVEKRVGTDNKARKQPAKRTAPTKAIEQQNHEEPDDNIESEIEPQHLRSAFLLRADQAERFAFYSGKVDQEVATAARGAATVWNELATKLEGER